MKCPRCGADNAERAPWCSLCQYRFGETATGEAPSDSLYDPAPQYQPGYDAAPQYQQGPAAYPPTPGGQVYPPNVPIQPSGYGYPPPPGAYPPGYQPVPTSQGLSGSARVLIGILAILLFLALIGVGIFIITNKSATIQVPIPPGYQEASDSEKKSTEASMKANEPGLVLDNLYMSNNMDSAIIVFHEKMPLAEKPSSTDPNYLKEYYDKNKDEVLKAFAGGFEQAAGLGVDADIGVYEVEQLACGDGALHLTIEVSVGRNSLFMDMLLIIKGSTGFCVALEAPDDAGMEATTQFLKDNISFK